jgi:anti-sigma regulatory factor (Ser/Thr protein kinase)
MQNYNTRMILYSSIAILVLVVVWGFRQIPAAHKMSEAALSASLDQELPILSSAIRSSTQAMKYRLLDVLKAEGTDRTSRTFIDSPFVMATLLEWDQVQWKTLWVSTKPRAELPVNEIKEAMKSWPLSTIAPDEVFYVKVADLQGQAQFAIVAPVRRPNQIPMLGVGVFPASEFGLALSSDPSREIQVFDTNGFALALSRPAYLGSSLKRSPMVKEMLESDEIRLSHEWKGENGAWMSGRAARVPGSNLIASVQSPTRIAGDWTLQGWLYLVLCGAGAIALNWYLFTALLKPLLAQLNISEEVNEKMRRKLQEVPALEPKGVVLRPELASAPLAHLDFTEDAPEASDTTTGTGTSTEAQAENGPVPLGKLVRSTLRRLNDKIQEVGINVMTLGFDDIEVENDPVQLQTAIEEVLKNSIEAMAESVPRNLTLSAEKTDDRIRLIVEDSGCGILPENLDKVFDPFYSTKDSEGVSRGLGLNVVRRVMEEIHGNVKVSSHRDGGTRVTLEWPLDPLASIDIGESGIQLETDLQNDFQNDLQDELEDAIEILQGPLKLAQDKSWPDIEIRRPRVRTLD